MNFRRFLFLLGLGIGGAWMTRVYLLEAVSVATGSMSPTLQVGAHYLVDKVSYRMREPRRGEIIVFRDPMDPEIGMIKRVIGIPGDRIELREKRVILNGNLLEEPFAQHVRSKEKLLGDNLGPLIVPEAHVFVLGDNRDVSDDSASWKDRVSGEAKPFLPRGNIKGRLIELL